MNSTKAEHLGIDQQRYIEVADQRERMKLIIVDSDAEVVLDSIEPNEPELRLVLSDDRTRFRGKADSIVKSLIAYCVDNDERQSRIAFLDKHNFVRLTRLDGKNRSLFAVTLETFRGGDSLSRATRKYQLTPREIEVLALILEGASAIETAKTLKIAETTVQGYYKRLLSKTHSRNRAAMVANVLEWSGRQPQMR